MGLILLQFLPLAIAAIAPTLIGLVVLFLSADQGKNRAWAFILGKYLASLLWGTVFLVCVGAIHLTRKQATPRPAIQLIEVFAGGLLIALALHTALGEDDPDAPPPKIMAILDKLGPVIVFSASLVWSLFQVRFIALLFVGSTMIATAELPGIETLLTLLILAVTMIWPLLVPVGIFFAMGDRGKTAMQDMRTWLKHRQRFINAAILAATGLVLAIRGLTAL